MRKALVLSLVLVMALASSAFAAVNLSGEFKAEIANDGKDFSSDIKVTPTFTVNIGASSESEGNWSFEAESSLVDSEFKLGKYKLALEDDYFELYFWGNGKELSDKGSALGLISAGKAADDDGNRARLVVDAIEPVELTADFTQDALYVFAEADVIEDVTAGIAYLRKGTSVMDKDATNTIGVYGTGTVDMFTIQGDVAATLGVETEADEDDADAEEDKGLGIALGYAAKISAAVTPEIDVWAEYKGSQDGFVGSDVEKSKISVGATYEETALKVEGSFAQDLAAESNEISASATYRFSDTLGFADLFKSDKYYDNDAPAVGLSAKMVDFEIDNVTLNVASPVVEDLIWARAEAKYVPTTVEADEDDEEAETETAHNFELGAYGYIKATEKLTVEPSVEYKTANSVLTLKGAAGYKIGSSDTTLNLEVAKNFYPEDAEKVDSVERIKASVTVEF